MDDPQSAGVTPSYIYSIGRIEVRFPNISIEKEYRQTMGRTDTAGQNDYETMRSVLSSRSNRYLAREMCWILTIEGVETYILKPSNPMDFELLVESLRNAPTRNDLDLVIGVKGPIASPEMCNGLMIPIVIFDQIYSLIGMN
jgi:hypothetical protein